VVSQRLGVSFCKKRCTMRKRAGGKTDANKPRASDWIVSLWSYNPANRPKIDSEPGSRRRGRKGISQLGRTRSGTRTNDGLPLLCRCPGVFAGDCHGEPARRGSRVLRPRHNTHLLRLTSQFYLREAPNCAVISPASRHRLIRHHCLSPQPQLILSASHSVSRIPAARSKIRHL
jgi:hypothetical protein